MSSGVLSKSALRLGGNLSHYPDNQTYLSNEDELQLGEYDLIPLTTESISEDADYSGAETINEGYSLATQDKLTTRVSGNMNVWGWYGGLDQLLSASLGEYNTSELTTGEYEHIYTIDDELTDRFTLGIDKKTELFVYRGCKVNSLGIDFSIENGIELQANVQAFDVTRDSSTNTSSDSWDVVSRDKIIEHQGEFYLDGSNIKIVDFTIDIGNGLDYTTTIQSGEGVSEPLRNDMVTVEGEITFARFEDTGLFSDFYNGKVSDLKLEFVGPNMGSNDKKFVINIPYAKHKSPRAPVTGESKIPYSFSFTGLRGTSLSSPVKVTTINEYPYNGGR